MNDTHEYCYLSPGQSCVMRATCKFGYLPKTTTKILFSPAWTGENCEHYDYVSGYGRGSDNEEND